MKEAYDEGQRTGSSLPVVEQGAREAGGWLGSMAGGALAGAALGAAFGIEGGPLALVTGLAGGIVGGIVGTEGVNRGIDALHQTANDFKAGFDAFIKPMYSPSAAGPWGGW
jgi:hypothetical protein